MKFSLGPKMLSPAILLVLVHFSHAQFNPGFNQQQNQQQNQQLIPGFNQQQNQQQNQQLNQQQNQQLIPGFNQQQNQQQNQQLIPGFNQQQNQQANSLSDRTIYQFIKSNPRTTRFGELVDRVSQQAVQSLANVLSSTNQVSGRAGVNSLTVFVPVNEALVQIPSDISMIKNDLENLVVVEHLNLDRMRELNNQQIPKTLGYRPRLTLRTVKNFYLFNRDLASTQSTQMNQKRQAVLPLATTYSPQQLSQSNMNLQQQTNDSSAYDMYASAADSASSNSPISTKLPYDEVFFLNYAMVLDMFELSNGLVYLINEYPRFYDKSLLVLFNENDVPGLAQNLNYWIARAAQSFRMGNENLKNALNAYGPNTYFLPTDSAMSKFNDRERLTNDTFLFDQLFKAHRVSNQILFDYYLDDHSPTVMTDTGLPVVTKHYRSGGQEVIEVSIGHVKGRILPNYRNIYCASGVIHLVDTVLGIPGRNAYQEISNIQELSAFKALVDRSQTYRQMLDQTPSQNLNMASIGKRQIQTANNSSNMFANQASNQMQQFNADPNFKLMTILAPNNAALVAIKDQLTSNMTAIEQLLSNHIIVDNNANRVFFTDHDQSVFQNGQSYSTMNANFMLTAKVAQDATGTMNRVTLHLSGNEAVRTRIVNGNSRVSNGVVHIVDRVLSLTGVMDITAFLERYSAQNMPNQPAFNQFVKELRDTGIFSELNQPEKKYTLFIPTDEALARYQQVLGSNNAEQKKNLLYRHICMDQNLQSNLIQTSNAQYQDLICRNLLGQDLTLTKDQSGLVSKWMDNSKSKILNDFSGVYSSAYVIEEPLLNDMLPNYGLNNLNSAFGLESSLFVFCFGLVVFFMA